MANYSNYPTYNPYQYYPTQNNAYQTQGTSQGQTQNQTLNGGFVSIPNEEMVYSYPVAMGNCVTFKVEGKPIVMEKSMGFSQFESPKIKRFRLVEEEAEATEEPKSLTDMDKVKSDIKEIWDKLDEIENSSKKNPPKRENKSGED